MIEDRSYKLISNLLVKFVKLKFSSIGNALQFPILDRTSKAIKIRTFKNISIWIPVKALSAIPGTDEFIIKQWFKDKEGEDFIKSLFN